MFSPVEVRNPAPPSSTSKAKTPGKESSSKKSKKKATIGASGIEDIAGSLNLIAEPGPVTRSMAGGKEEDRVGQHGDDNDDMYATEEDSDVDEGGGDIRADGSADPPPRKKRKSTQKGKGKTPAKSTRGPTTKTTPATVAEANVTQDRHQPGSPPTSSDISMAIDPALEVFHVPGNQPPPQASGSGGGI